MPKRFILKAVLFISIASGSALVWQWALVLGLTSYKTSSRGVWNKVIRGEVNAEVIVCGSSRALVHYDPAMIAAETGRSAFNLGRNGTAPDLQLSFLKTYLAHNRAPVCILQNIDSYCLGTTKQIFDPSQYIPYLNEPALYK